MRYAMKPQKLLLVAGIYGPLLKHCPSTIPHPNILITNIQYLVHLRSRQFEGKKRRMKHAIMVAIHRRKTD
jgi:hypothetical protein